MIKLKIEGIQQEPDNFGGLKVTIISGGKKYGFYSKKKDGLETKAFAQFKKYGFQIGDTVDCEVKEEQKPIKSEPGKMYTARSIMYFAEIENTPVFQRPSPNVPVQPKDGSNSGLSDLIGHIRKLEQRVTVLEGIVLKEEEELDQPF